MGIHKTTQSIPIIIWVEVPYFKSERDFVGDLL